MPPRIDLTEIYTEMDLKSEENSKLQSVRQSIRDEFPDCFKEVKEDSFTHQELKKNKWRLLRSSLSSNVWIKGDEVAKQLKPPIPRLTPNYLKQMRTELKIMRLDNKENLLNYMTKLEVWNGYLTIVSKACEFGSLSNITANTQLPLEAFKWIVVCTTEAVASLHDKGFMHGDIKRDQFLVKKEGVDGVSILLTDFGNAQANEDSENTQTATQDYARCLLFGKNADLASLAVVLFMMACGQHPWALDGGNKLLISCDPSNTVPMALKRKIPEIYPGIDEGLLELLINMLVVDTKSRPGESLEQSTNMLGIDSKSRPSADDVVCYMKSKWSEADFDRFRKAARRVFEENSKTADTAAATSAVP